MAAARRDDIKSAMWLAKDFLDTLVCDDGLMGSVESVPENLLADRHWPCKFLAALLSLYAGQFVQALDLADAVLAVHQCQEALYVKSRALAMLGRYREADEVNVQIGENYDAEVPDAKVAYMVSMLNELHIGDPGVNIMRSLVDIRPKYDHGICALRRLMKRRGITLDSSEENELVEAFNSDCTEEDFDALLKKCRKEEPEWVSNLIQRIRMQDLGEM